MKLAIVARPMRFSNPESGFKIFTGTHMTAKSMLNAKNFQNTTYSSLLT